MAADLTLVPKVTSLAKPSGQVLIAARFEVQRNNELRAVMEEFKGQTGEEAAANLTAAIEPILAHTVEGTPAEIAETSRYLADEYLQIGDSVLVIDRETGLAVLKISDEDMWEPALVPRESGSMAKPLPRLRPELQGYLVRWHFEKHREEKLVEDLKTRLVQTEADRELGDRRLLATTMVGRKALTGELEAVLPFLLPNAVGGYLRGLYDVVSVTADGDIPCGFKAYPGFKAYAKVAMGMHDAKARNLLFDVFTSHRSAIAAQWTREVARTITRLADQEKDSRTCHVDASLPEGLWIAPPDEAAALVVFPTGSVVPVEGAVTTLVTAPIAHLVLGKTEIASREVHGRWEIAATIEYALYLNLDHAQCVFLDDMPPTEARAVVVR